MQLTKGETLLWEGMPIISKKLSSFKGWHDWVARLFFAQSAVLAVLVYVERAEVGQIGLSWNLLGFVGGPIVVGLAVRLYGRWIARRAARAMRYAVTTQRVLITTRSHPISFMIKADSPITLDISRSDVDLIRLSDVDRFQYENQDNITRHIYTAPRGLVLSKQDGPAAFAAITAVKEGAAAA